MVRIREENTIPIRLWQRLIRNDQFVLSLLAVAVGIAGAHGAIGFRLAVDTVQLIFYGAPPEQVYAVAIKFEPATFVIWT